MDQPYFFNTARQPPVARTMQRSCSLESMIWAAAGLAAANFVVQVLWIIVYLNGISAYPVAIAVISGALMINLRFTADYVHHRNETWSCYVLLVVELCSVFALLWTTVALYVTQDEVCATHGAWDVVRG